jgi:predicted SprT family Zn-dependent metalloprotease
VNLLVSKYKSRAVVSPTDETYDEWQMAYDHFNDELFGGKLPTCLLTFQREKHTMGYFSQDRFSNRLGRKTDEIALNPSYFAVCPVNESLQTLVHEMTHLWQHHFGKPGRGRYHNKEWADKMESIGLMPSTTGHPGGKRTGDKLSDYIIAGGLLETSIKRLKNRGFSLLWMDRYG